MRDVSGSRERAHVVLRHLSRPPARRSRGRPDRGRGGRGRLRVHQPRALRPHARCRHDRDGDRCNRRLLVRSRACAAQQRRARRADPGGVGWRTRRLRARRPRARVSVAALVLVRGCDRRFACRVPGRPGRERAGTACTRRGALQALPGGVAARRGVVRANGTALLDARRWAARVLPRVARRFAVRQRELGLLVGDRRQPATGCRDPRGHRSSQHRRRAAPGLTRAVPRTAGGVAPAEQGRALPPRCAAAADHAARRHRRGPGAPRPGRELRAHTSSSATRMPSRSCVRRAARPARHARRRRSRRARRASPRP